MNGYLLVLIYLHDDIPVRFFETMPELQSHIDEKYPENWDGELDGDIAEIWNIGLTGPLYMDSVEFRGGKPVSRECARWFL